MSNTPIPVGVVGVGHLGYHHARLYTAAENAELVGICDAREDHGREVAAEFGTDYFDSVDALIAKGIKAASVAVPTRVSSEGLKPAVALRWTS